MPKSKSDTMASQADKYVLYQRSVQEPSSEIKFFNKVFKTQFGRKPVSLREDFCGTFAICCDWVASNKDRIAVGVDLDPEPLDWGRQHNLAKLKPKQQDRVTLLQQDVRTSGDQKFDILSAQNFSFWIFKTRPQLLEYLKHAHNNLNNEGMMVMDMMGGGECWVEDHTDIRKFKDFRYEWEQNRLDPITHDCTFHIHFAFKDGSRLDRAFTYEWRFWSIPEVVELCKEAGFGEVDVYWEGTDADGEGNGIYTAEKSAHPDPCWIAYIVGIK
jgi:hypothetical protein